MKNRSRTAPSSHRAVLVVVCIALAAVVAAMASLNVALPDIARSTHASQSDLQWIVAAYSLLFAALLLPAGAIGDRFGRRRALLVGLSIFGAGSAIAMTTSSAAELIGLRGLLGVGAALVMPATLSTITSTMPEDARERAVGIWAAVAGGAAVLGLLVSGVLLNFFSWQSVFGLNVVLALLAGLGTIRCVPESADPQAPRIDLVGAGLAFVALVALVFSVIEAPGAGWLAARTLGGIALAFVLGVGFVAWELRQAQPMLDPRLFARRGLSAGAGSIFVQFFAFYGFIFIALQYLQLVRGDSPIEAAVSVLPMAVTMISFSRLSPTLVARFGTRWVCGCGLALVAVGIAILAQVDTDTSYLLFAAGLVVLGAGMGAAMAPATSSITESLPASRQGVASALNDLSRELGGALGIAVIGSVLDAVYRSHLVLPGASPAVVSQAKDSLGVAQVMGGAVATHAHTAFVSGLHVALLCAAGAAAMAAFGVVVALRSRAGSDLGDRAAAGVPIGVAAASDEGGAVV